MFASSSAIRSCNHNPEDAGSQCQCPAQLTLTRQRVGGHQEWCGRNRYPDLFGPKPRGKAPHIHSQPETPLLLSRSSLRVRSGRNHLDAFPPVWIALPHVTFYQGGKAYGAGLGWRQYTTGCQSILAMRFLFHSRKVVSSI
jgi:hypothetical protein